MIDELNQLSGSDFELLCFDAVQELGFINCRLQFSGTQFGHDIGAEYKVSDDYLEQWMFECKRYDRAVPLSEVSNKLIWADQRHNLRAFVVMSNAKLSNDFHELTLRPRPTGYFILSWTDEVFLRMLSTCASTKLKWFGSKVIDNGISSEDFLREERTRFDGYLADLRSTKKPVRIRVSKAIPMDSMYLTIRDSRGRQIIQVHCLPGEKLDVLIPEEYIGIKVELEYDFFPGCCVLNPYPNSEYITLETSLPAIPTNEMIKRLESSIGEIKTPLLRFPAWFRRWQQSKQVELGPP